MSTEFSEMIVMTLSKENILEIKKLVVEKGMTCG
jgi:hypothetical protein